MKIGTSHEARDNSKKAEVLHFFVCAMLFALCVSAEAQQQTRKVYRIGYLSGRSGPGPLD